MWPRRNREGSLITAMSSALELYEWLAWNRFVVGVVCVCAGTSASCPTASFMDRAQVIDLEGGSISPGLVTFGAPLGLEEISGEASTGDGAVLDPFYDKVPSITGGDKSLIRAVDGLQYGGRDVLCVLSSPVFRFPA